jgi:nicotinate-nucleotide adenylyltransferase
VKARLAGFRARARAHPLRSGALAGELAAEFARRSAEPAALRRTPAGGITSFRMPPLDISASAIRAAIAAGRSPRYLLPDAVLAYIATHHLYSTEESSR